MWLTKVEQAFDTGPTGREEEHMVSSAAPVAVDAPSSRRAAELLARADAELLAAQYSPEAWERFSHAHLAALRAGAALVAARGKPGGRRAPRSVWGMVAVVAPELSRWAEHFEEAARLRSAVEAGRFDVVSADRGDQALCDAEDFVDAVRDLVDDAEDAGRGPRMLAVRAAS
jgi:hypothetical protein